MIGYICVKSLSEYLKIDDYAWYTHQKRNCVCAEEKEVC